MAVVELRDALQIYREFAQFPSVCSARVSTTGADVVTVTSEWNQRDLERLEKSKYTRTTTLSREEFHVVTSSLYHGVPTELWRKESPSGNLVAVVLKTKTKKGEDKFYTEIWNKTQKLKTVDVTVADKHGDVYEADGVFGTCEWSTSEGHILYVAEKKRAKTLSYFDPKANAEDDKSTDDVMKSTDDVMKGDENVLIEDWGELLVGKHHPVLCVLDVSTGTISVLDNVPEDVSPGQAVWCPDDSGVVFVGWTHEPFRLGLIYCPIRRSVIYHIDLQSATCSVVGSLDQSVRSPVFSPDKSKLIYLQNPFGGPHFRCSQLIMCDWKTKCCSVVVDIVHKPMSGDFHGIFLLSLSPRCWANDNKRILLHSFCRSKQELYIVNTEIQTVNRLSRDDSVGSWTLLDIHDDIVVATTASPSSPQRLMFASLPPEGEEGDIRWQYLDKECAPLDDVTWKIVKHQVAEQNVNQDKDGYYADLYYESVLLLPKAKNDGCKPPLVIYPHGGPHSVFPADFALYPSTLCRCGFAVLLVNYRGSVGFGQCSVESLPGNIGTQDVNDVYAATRDVLDLGVIDSEQIFITGGSHGGFLTAHIIGQFPTLTKAAALRNPVINIATMIGSTDIPDWSLVESGLPYDQREIPGKAAYMAAWDRSPIRYAHQVKTPSLLMIGAGDKRVPPKQGEEFYKALKANQCQVRMLYIPENSHPLNKVDCEADCFVNIFKWFSDHI